MSSLVSCINDNHRTPGLILLLGPPRVLADLLKNLLILRESSTLFLVVVNHVVIYGHFIDAPMPLFQFDGDAKLFIDCGRQTGGLTPITSFNAIGNLDIHLAVLYASIAHDRPPLMLPTVARSAYLIKRYCLA